MSAKEASGISRRRFLGGSAAAAAGAVWLSPVEAALARVQESPTPALGAGLERLRPAGARVDEAYWAKVRREFNLVDDVTYMNNGTLGPMPRPVFEANVRYLRDVMEDPRAVGSQMDAVRQKVATFVGADADEIVLTRSTTEGMKIFCHGLDLREGDEVLMCSHEHGGGTGPYRLREKRHGIKVNAIDVPAPPESADQIVSLYEKAITPRTRVLMVSHMTYVTGLVMPVKALTELAHRRGLLISVDGAHPVGMLELNFHEFGCDHYAASGQKWLLAGTGTGVCYVKRDVQGKVWSDMMSANEDPKAGARKYERSGQRDIPSALGMADAIDFQNAVGRRHIEARARELSTRLKAGLQEIPGVKLWTPMSPELSGGLTLFSVRDVPMENVVKVIMDRQAIFIRTMTTGRLNACRVSTHMYNTPAEVDRLLEGVRHIAQNSSRYMTTA